MMPLSHFDSEREPAGFYYGRAETEMRSAKRMQ